MSNMSYCRYHNTLLDLRDCFDHWDAEDYVPPSERPNKDEEDEDDWNENDNEMLSEDETEARASLLKLCKRIVDQYGDEENE